MKFAMVRVVGVLIDSYRQFMHSFNLQQDYFQVGTYILTHSLTFW